MGMRLIVSAGPKMYKLKFKYFHPLYYMKESLEMNGVEDGMLARRTYCRSFLNLIPKA